MTPTPARRLVGLATADRVLATAVGRGLWSALLTGPGLRDGPRVRLARTVADRVSDTGRAPEAARLLRRTAPRVRSVAARTDLVATAAQTAMANGEVPEGVSVAAGGLLALADKELAAGRIAAAAPLVTRASDLLFHRSANFDDLRSPLAADPARWLAPWRASTAYKRLTARAGRTVPARSGPPRRLLFVTYHNWNFMGPLIDRYDRRPDVEVRRLDLADLPVGLLPLSPAQQVRLRLRGSADPTAAWAAALQEHLDWADTVWVEWCQRAAVLVAALDPARRRTIVRLHSFEAFTVFPHLLDLSRVDDLVFVGPQVRDFLRAVRPDAEQSTVCHVLPNAVELRGLRRPKLPGASRTLALLGWANVAKDPLWAVEVLALLRGADPAWRLLLVGHEVSDDSPPALRRYAGELDRRLAEPDVVGAVERTGHVTDVGRLLERVGVIVSSSVRESFHLGLVEGAASGAVPVVRDWPIYAAYGGARGLFPAEWVVGTAAEAAALIRVRCADDGALAAYGGAAADYSIAQFDWAVVGPRYDQLLLGGPLKEPA